MAFSKHTKHVLVLVVIFVLVATVNVLIASGFVLGSLPGDTWFAILEYNLYFPITTSIIVSSIFNLTVYLFYSLARHWYLERQAKKFPYAQR